MGDGFNGGQSTLTPGDFYAIDKWLGRRKRIAIDNIDGGVSFEEGVIVATNGTTSDVLIAGVTYLAVPWEGDTPPEPDQAVLIGRQGDSRWILTSGVFFHERGDLTIPSDPFPEVTATLAFTGCKFYGEPFPLFTPQVAGSIDIGTQLLPVGIVTAWATDVDGFYIGADVYVYWPMTGGPVPRKMKWQMEGYAYRI